MSLSAIRNQPRVDLTTKLKEQETCAICIAKFDPKELSDITEMACGHIYHTPCIDRWFQVKRNCPTCRREFPSQNQAQVAEEPRLREQFSIFSMSREITPVVLSSSLNLASDLGIFTAASIIAALSPALRFEPTSLASAVSGIGFASGALMFSNSLAALISIGFERHLSPSELEDVERYQKIQTIIRAAMTYGIGCLTFLNGVFPKTLLLSSVALVGGASLLNASFAIGNKFKKMARRFFS